MKNSEILQLTTEEVTAKINEEKTNLTKLKFAHTISTIENPIRITLTRKNIARLNTELTKRKTNARMTEVIAELASVTPESASE